jgi:hypothetical protein
MVNFICSISSVRCFASLSNALARASAASSAARVSRIIACAAAKSVGSFASETAPTIHRV